MKSRRGISSVVGAVFAIIALGTTVGYITYSMTTLDNYNQTVLAKNQQLVDIAKEKFQLSSATFVGNRLNITVLNTGSLPINITKVWISNQTASSCLTYSCNISFITNKVVSPGLTQTNIGQSMPSGLFLNTNKPYNVKLVTSRGNMLQFNVNSVGTAPVDIQFYALPSNVKSGYTTELVMVVKNNGTGTLSNIVPALPSNSGTATLVSISALPTPSSYNTLSPGSTAIFKWDVTLTGQAGQSKIFTASLQNGFAGNTASTAITVDNVGSVNVPLNIQLIALPATVPSGFKTELVMIVTNNGTGTITATPSALPIPSYTGTAGESCIAGQVSPSTYTLAPGSSGIFKWDVAVSGGSGDTCTYSITTPLVGGNSQTVSTTITTTIVALSSTTYSQSAGIVTLNYSSFKWTQTGQGAWKTGFTWSSSGTTAFKLNMTNNNSTGKLWLSKKTLLLFYSTRISPSQQPTPFYIVNFTNAATMATTKYDTCNGQSDYCLSIPPLGTATLYLAAASKGTNTAQNFGGNADIETVFLLVFGKFTPTQTGAGPEYAQNTPYIAADVT